VIFCVYTFGGSQGPRARKALLGQEEVVTLSQMICNERISENPEGGILGSHISSLCCAFNFF